MYTGSCNSILRTSTEQRKVVSAPINQFCLVLFLLCFVVVVVVFVCSQYKCSIKFNGKVLRLNEMISERSHEV